MDAESHPLPPAPPFRLRRALLFGGAGVAAAAAGAGIAWWRFDAANASSAAVADLWSTAFETPQGASLQMQAFRGRPLLVNFWATWCPPCIEELPLLEAFYKQNTIKSWQVLGLAIDQPSAVKAFLNRTPVTYPVGMAGLEGSRLVNSLGNTAGGLPYTIVLAPSGAMLQRKIGRISASDLSAWIGSV